MFPVRRVEGIIIFLVALNLYGLVMGGDDLKDDNIDRGSRSDRGGLWFGPRLGKRSLRLINDDNRQTFLRLLEAADALKYYYDQLSYESQGDDPDMKVTKKVIFTPKLGRALNEYESVDFTPRLGRRLAEDRVTPSDQDNYRPEVEQMDRNKYFSPRLGRTMNFSPRLGRELSYGFIGLIMSISNGHVLIATDVEEFRNLAKKLVPVNIADQLVEIVSKTNYNHNNNEYQLYNFDSKEDDEYYYDGYDYKEKDEEPFHHEEHRGKPVSRQGMNSPDTEQLSHEPTQTKQAHYETTPKPMEVNLDDLVEKVRERLLDDFQKNPTELQKLLSSKSVMANLKNGSNQFIYSKKLKMLRDRHEQKHNQQFRPETGQKILRPQQIKIERKDSRYRPGLRIARPQASNKEKNEYQVQAFEDDNLPSRYRPKQKISRLKANNKEIRYLKAQGYEEDDLLTRYRPEKVISKTQTNNKEIKDVQAQAYKEQDLLTRYRPGKIISRPQSSNKDSNAVKLQAYTEDNLPAVDQEGNIRVPKELREKSPPEFIFQEFDLNSKKIEKDTYEDYVTPKKEENIFVSEESETTNKQAKSSPRWSQQSIKTQKLDIFDYKLQNGLKVSSQTFEQTNPKVTISSTSPSIFDESNETTTEPDLKARTENLWFDYKDEPIEKVIQKNAEATAKGETKQAKLGTMIPTRETYKMTSPNYYGQLPTVAEKYNFDEPIPEKDREREDLKPIGNPPANINGRIKV